jgi:inorganic phosphate transporter, PiT family
MWKVVSGIFLGWTLGSNDSANIFGTGVAAKIIRYRTAIILISIFVILGAVVEGKKCFSIVGKLSNLTPESTFFVALAAGITMFILTYLALPCSTSQAVIGAVLGAGIVSGMPEFSRLYKIVACWLLAPISASIISFLLYYVKTLLDEIKLREYLNPHMIHAIDYEISRQNTDILQRK